MSTDLLSLFSLFCVLVLPYALWRLGGLGSIVPCAVVQICLGIALGPAGLGRVAPGLEALLFPAAVRSRVDGLAAFAILFFALITGLHLDLSHYRGRVRSFLLVGVGSVAVPFVLAAGAAAWIWLSFPSVRTPAGGIPFIAATAIALSVTALPVLGAILSELDLTGAPIGHWSLGLAAMNDAALWLLVGLLLAVYGHSETSLGEQALRVSAGAVYLAAMFGFVQPALGRLLHGREIAADTLLVLVTAFALASAAATEFAGLHYLLGAFVAGGVLPASVRARVLSRIEHATVFLLTPFFFLASGFKVTFDSAGEGLWQIVLVTTLATVAGKYLGTTLPARMAGLTWRDGAALGSLMQAKGMMELAVLAILHEAGLIPGLMFSALTVMAVVTTTLAMPATRLLLGTRQPAAAPSR